MKSNTKRIFIEFGEKLDDYVHGYVGNFGYYLKSFTTITNANSNPALLEQAVVLSDEIWMNSVLVQESRWAVEHFIKKFYEQQITGKAIINLTSSLSEYLSINWREFHGGDTVKINGVNVFKIDVIQWVLANNKICELEGHKFIKRIKVKPDPGYDDLRAPAVSDEIYMEANR